MSPGGPPAPAQVQRRKNLRKLNQSPNVGRFAIVNHFNTMVDALAPTTNFPRLKAFLPQNLWPWITNYLKFLFHKKFPFPDASKSRTRCIYTVAPAAGASEVRMAIAGDWGTGTQEAETITNLMVQTHPDLTLHLGDVYYVGGEPEIKENCFGVRTGEFDGVKWLQGVQGSLALNGNHEMYANGGPYFTIFLPSLGLNGSGEKQVASFFCLEVGGWRILAIDTGYNSVGFPILSLIPLINRIPAIGGDCHLEKALIEWLRNDVKPQQNPKPTLILSHHQYFSAFEKAYTKPAKQLTEFFPKQDVVWMWGHEHRLSIYDKGNQDGGINAYGRCLGHGGMPVEIATPDATKAPLQFYDPRSTLLDGTPVGVNGYVMAAIAGDVLTFDYRDVSDKRLFVEEFRPAPDGSLGYRVVDRGTILKPPPVSQ
jgi:hypothetical protein